MDSDPYQFAYGIVSCMIHMYRLEIVQKHGKNLLHAHFKLFTFGNVKIELDGKPIDRFPSRAAEAALIYLAYHNHPIPRDTLATLFWEGRTQKNARGNLRTILSALKQTLGDYLIVTRHDVAFNHQTDSWFDCVAFENLLAQYNTDGDLETLKNGIALYRGDFLAGFHVRDGYGFEEWALPVQERLRQLAATGLRHLIRHQLREGDYLTALAQLNRLHAIDPFDEIAHRQLMTTRLRCGQRTRALQDYQTFRQWLAEEMDVEPEQATTDLYLRIKATPFPPPQNLPALTAPFVGRTNELATIRRLLLCPNCRLISILGPGGIGKTSLSIEAARHLLEEHPGQFFDGVFFVSLVNLEASTLLPYYVANVVSSMSHHAEFSETQLFDFLRDKELLLILDNFEHLISPVSVKWLSQLLDVAPKVKILLTSRGRLNLQEEYTLDLRGLSYPVDSTQNAEEFSAIRLFLQHANRVRHKFEPGADEMAAIVRLCQLVDGMPLAIELAAAETRYFLCSRIVSEIENRLDFESLPAGNRPPRHASLRATIEYSWALLAESEPIIHVARRLAVFHGSFDLNAAMKITNATPHQLVSLVDRSFLQRNEHGFFELHPLIRQFLIEKLAEHPAEEKETCARHADWYTELIKSAGGREHENMERYFLEIKHTVETHFDNIVAAALHLAREHHFPERRMVSLIEALIFHFEYSHRYQEWKIVFRQLINTLQQNSDGSHEERWLTLVLSSRIIQADISLHAYPQAEKQLQAIMADVYALGNEALTSACLEMKSVLAARAGDFSTALAYTDEASTAVVSYANHYQWSVYRVRGDIAMAAGDFAQATAAHEKAFELAAAADSEAEALPVYKLALGKIARRQGYAEEARTLLNNALTAARTISKQEDIIACLTELGWVSIALGDFEAAHRHLTEGVSLNKTLHDRRLNALLALAQGRLAEAQKNTAEAQQFYRHGMELFAEIDDRANLPFAQTYLARILLQRGEAEAAHRLIRDAAGAFERQSQPEGIALVQALNTR